MKLSFTLTFLWFCSFFSFSGAWEQKADFLGISRHRATGIAVGNKAYVGLGHYNGAGPNILFNDWWEYDPATNAWTQKADYLGGDCYHAAAFTIGNVCYVGTGRISAWGNTLVKSFFKYNPATNSWSSIADFAGSARRGAVAFTVNGIGYVGTGETNSGRTKTFYKYDPNTDTWTQVASLPGAGRTSSVGFSIGNSGYVGTGNTSSGSTNDFWEYKPSVDQWVQRANCSMITRQEAAGFEVNGKGYILTGDDFSSGNNFKDMWEFEPATNTWTQIANFKGTARRYLTSLSFGNYAYAGLGTNGTNFHDWWLFDASLAYLEENIDNIDFTVYPNPSRGNINFKIENVGSILKDIELQVYSSLGQKVIQETIYSGINQFDFSHLENGSYFYVLSYDSTPFKNGKLIIQK